MKALIILTFAFTLAGVSTACDFDPQEACNHCFYDRNWIQYVADGCNCTKFYMCEKRDGVITYHQQECDACHCFSNDDWSCSRQIKPLTQCPPPKVYTSLVYTKPIASNFFCVDLDGDSRETRKYYDMHSSCYTSYAGTWWSLSDPAQTGLSVSDNALLTFGYPCNIEVPYFQNNQFRTFTLCGYFMWFDWYNQPYEMGLAYNGYADDCYPGSIRIYKSADNHVEALVTVDPVFGSSSTPGISTPIRHPNTVAPYTWHKVCLRFDGRVGTLELSVNDSPIAINKPIKLKGLTKAMKCNMRYGEVLEKFPGGYYIYSLLGAMDSWCFSTELVPDSYFMGP